MRQILVIIILVLTGNIYSQDRPLMGNELGILEMQLLSGKENIVIYNQDGSIWMKFDYDFENKLQNKENYTFEDIKKLYKWNDEFNPYAFHIEYSLLMFKCTGEDKDKFKVVVNERTGLEKYIRKDKFWILRDWQDHLIHSVASIDFDIKTNPIKTSPDDEKEHVKVGADIDPVIQPIEIIGDWLKIKYWENDIEKAGWIKWKINNQIIVTLYYLI